MQNNKNLKSNVTYVEIKDGEEGQRIDNYLLNKLKSLPKSRLYRLLRKGEVRVNKKRISPFYRLELGDIVRIPPVFLEEKGIVAPPSDETCEKLVTRILYEDEFLLILNKPSGMSVHAGSTVRMGVIEAMKHHYPHLPQLELAHRLDSETSGCLILAKKKRILRELHTLFREGGVKKIYYALTQGIWKKTDRHIDAPLHKHFRDGGKHVVEVNPAGKTAITEFTPVKLFKDATLCSVNLLTGRTHQIRVHAAYKDHPIACDDRYGNTEFNKTMRNHGLKRLFLHAHSIDFILPINGKHIKVEAPLDEDLTKLIQLLERK